MDSRFWGIRFFPRSGRPQPGLAMAARRDPFFSPPRAGQGMPVGLPLFWTKYPISHWFYKVFCDFRLQVESAFEQNTSFSIGFYKVFCDFRSQVKFTFEQNTLFSQVFLRFLGVSVATRISTFPRIPCFPNVFLVFGDFWLSCQGRAGSRIWPDLWYPFFFPR